jgi:hypothetical protein
MEWTRRLRERLRAYQWRRLRCENQREILRLEAEHVACGIERWGYEWLARDCRRHWAKASEGRRDNWRKLAERGF